jgi:hypothetical protein
MKIHIKVLIATLLIFLPCNNLLAAEKQANNMMVLFSSNVYGETEPCG